VAEPYKAVIYSRNDARFSPIGLGPQTYLRVTFVDPGRGGSGPHLEFIYRNSDGEIMTLRGALHGVNYYMGSEAEAAAKTLGLPL
jgi:hypothetical protein